MKAKRNITVLFRRKRQSKTDYNKRKRLLLSEQLRLVVRFTNKKVIAQLVSFTPKGDKVELALDSSELKKAGWNHSLKNLPSAYLTGILLAKKAQQKGFKEAILDTGLVTPQKKGKVYSFLKGVIDGGMEIPYGDDDVFPSPERLQGEHLTANKAQAAAEFKKVKEKIML